MRWTTLLIFFLAALPFTADAAEERVAQRHFGGGDEMIVKTVRHDGDALVQLWFRDGRTLVDEVTLNLPPAQARDLVQALWLGSQDREGLRGDEKALRTVNAGDTEIQLMAERRHLTVLLTQQDENVMLWLKDRHIRRIERDVEAAIEEL